jgi:hypothetical protein
MSVFRGFLTAVQQSFYKVNKNWDRRYAVKQKSTRDSIGLYWPKLAMPVLHDVNWQKIFGSKFVQARGEDKSVTMATGYITHLLNHCSPVLFSPSPAVQWILGSSRAFTYGWIFTLSLPQYPLAYHPLNIGRWIDVQIIFISGPSVHDQFWTSIWRQN